MTNCTCNYGVIVGSAVLRAVECQVVVILGSNRRTEMLSRTDYNIGGGLKVAHGPDRRTDGRYETRHVVIRR